ncbi:MAG TPA: stage II sporulation protein P [Defluviitaleaceae bacterium]|nr:stage II sporulation protein P [Defluviitaleaceae bacterium]HPT75378.1 stage II sporulation protein P [Defluviitaleaceae bacterium]
MVRIHTISLKKIKTQLWIGLLLLLVIGIIKLQEDKKLTGDIHLDRQITKYLKDQTLDSRTYKKILEETIPYVEDYSNLGHPSESVFSKSFLLFTGIHWDNLNSIIEIIIPTAKYFNIYSQEYAQNIAEIEGNFEEYKNNSSIIQDEEDYYLIEEESTEHPDFSGIKYSREQLSDINFLQKNLYNFEGNLVLTQKELPAVNLINKDLTIEKKNNQPQILIFHTHSQEAYSDSSPGDLDEGVVGLGEKLAKELHERYGVGVLHHKGQYDVVNGKIMREGSYERMEPALRKILKDNPSIEVVIDIHRDGLPDDVRLVTNINGKPTAKVMFVNGICKTMLNNKLVDIKSLPNPYIEENLAFSLQMQLKGNELYPGLLRKIYIKPYRYSLHMCPKSLMIEVGANTNTYEEAENAIEPLCEILAEVLGLEESNY